jgi:predicted MFS family arabinose efflux permease
VNLVGTAPQLGGPGAPRERGDGFDIATLVVLQLIGVIAGFGPMLQPLLLAQLAREGRLTLAQIGQAATCESLGMTVAACLLGALAPPRRLRLVTFGVAVVSLGANLATAGLSGEAILAARLVNGLTSGALLWVFVGALARIANPARQAAIHMTAQAVVLLALNASFSTFLFKAGGAAAGYDLIAVCAFVVALVAVALPRKYAALPGGTGRMPPARGWAGLLGVGLHLAAILAVWAYVVPIGRASGLAESVITSATLLAIGMQIVVGLSVVALAPRLRPTFMLLFSIGASLGAVGLIATRSPSLFVVGVALIGAFWIFMGPFQIAYLIGVDPTRRSAVQSITAQLLGLAVGPLIASLAVAGGGVAAALPAGAWLFIAAAGAIAATAWPGRRRSAHEGRPVVVSGE